MKEPLASLDGDLRGRLRPQERPSFVAPMLATLTDDRFSDPDWLFERKLDGVRAIAIREGEAVRLLSRNEKRMDNAYPELVGACGRLQRDRFVVDGEVVAFEGARTSFTRLQHRMHLQDPERARRSDIAVYLYLFDLLHLDGYDTTRLPLRTRKQLLRAAFDYADPIRFSTHRNTEGAAFYRQACADGWEGLIAKRADTPYRPGRRTRDWLKFKCLHRQELVVGGFTDPQGQRVGFGALLVGYYHDGRFRYAGKVGTGYDDATLRELRARLDRLERDTPPPFDEEVREKGAHWVEPRLVSEIEFTVVAHHPLLFRPLERLTPATAAGKVALAAARAGVAVLAAHANLDGTGPAPPTRSCAAWVSTRPCHSRRRPARPSRSSS